MIEGRFILPGPIVLGTANGFGATPNVPLVAAVAGQKIVITDLVLISTSGAAATIATYGFGVSIDWQQACARNEACHSDHFGLESFVGPAGVGLTVQIGQVGAGDWSLVARGYRHP